jgi:hypothetical protein
VVDLTPNFFLRLKNGKHEYDWARVSGGVLGSEGGVGGLVSAGCLSGRGSSLSLVGSSCEDSP